MLLEIDGKESMRSFAKGGSRIFIQRDSTNMDGLSNTAFSWTTKIKLY